VLFVDYSISGRRVIALLDEVAEIRGYPEAITCDNGSEFTCQVVDEWAHRHGVKMDFIRPGKPIENAYCESFNGKLRAECLILEVFRKEYYGERPHSSLNGLSPEEFAQRHTAMLQRNDTPRPQLPLA